MRAFHLRLLSATCVALLLSSTAFAREPVKAHKPPRAPKAGVKFRLPAAFRKPSPTSVRDLEIIEQHVQKLLPKLTAATVGVRAGRAQGSGVIVSPDGYVLTAGHVSGAADRSVTLIFADGKTAKGKTLGAYNTADAGMIKITEPGKYPFVPIGDQDDVHVGDWVIAMGHPGGYQRGRAPVVRLGRVIAKSITTIQTDAVLVGGDSGGPLFDMHGRVIGINSRIGRPTTSNYHASIAAFSTEWVGMARGKVWGRRGGAPTRAIMGINGEDHPKGCRVTGVPEGFPAEKAGLQVGDIITKMDGKPIKGFTALVAAVARKRPGDKVVVEFIRNGRTLRKTLTLARR